MTLAELTILAPIIVLLILETHEGAYSREKMSRNDWMINLVSLFQDNLIRPLLAFSLALLLINLLPQYSGSWSHLSFLPTLIAFMFFQDFIHYWYHRLAHEWPLLWKIHRVHHSSPNMNILVTSRIHFLWQLLMPVNYVSAILIYLGQFEVFITWWAFRAWLNYLTHTSLRWDLPILSVTWLKPFVWVIERVFTTPDAHHAHHGFGPSGKPMGNYAPVIIFWDFVFGTAYLPHSRQEQVGVENDPVYPWYQQLWWPIFPFATKQNISLIINKE
jgi:sterol desaturase/sphingolipid hydroxylase (fatty acid hydroxylase superfamily)